MSDPKVVASLSRRLLNESRKLGVPNELLVRRYGFERLLRRLELSSHSKELCLKGAMAFLAVTGDFHRPTKDMDFTGLEFSSAVEVVEMWKDIASVVTPEDDGLVFLPETFKSEEIQASSDEPGVRVLGMARLGTIRIPLKLEVSYGHAMTPGAVLMDYPTVLSGMPSGRILCYSKETILAEKFEAVCSLGKRNSRFKDFYDIRGLARSTDFDLETAAAALRNTFLRRGTDMPAARPDAFRPEFFADGQKGWAAFIHKLGVRNEQDFSQVVAEIEPFVMGIVEAWRQPGVPAQWEKGVGWVAGEKEDDDRVIVPFM
jgi:hypothetical protein